MLAASRGMCTTVVHGGRAAFSEPFNKHHSYLAFTIDENSKVALLTDARSRARWSPLWSAAARALGRRFLPLENFEKSRIGWTSTWSCCCASYRSTSFWEHISWFCRDLFSGFETSLADICDRSDLFLWMRWDSVHFRLVETMHGKSYAKPKIWRFPKNTGMHFGGMVFLHCSGVLPTLDLVSNKKL